MLFLHGAGHFHPENIIDNAFLAELQIGSDEEWILERVGIRERRTVLPLDYIRETRNANPLVAHEVSLVTNAQAGAAAARMALRRAGIGADRIGLVIAGGCSPQWLIPAEACLIANELGIRAHGYDVSSACSSFGAALHQLAGMRPEALPDYVLLVNVDNTTRQVDYSDRRTACLWGDGSAAVVLSARIPGPVGVVQTLADSDPSGWDKVVIPQGRHFSQDGKAVQAFAIRRTVATVAALRERADGDPAKLFFIGHQANRLMLQSACERLGIAPERHYFNVDAFGNCGAAGAPIVLSQHWERIRSGDEIALAVVGSGLTWAGALLRGM